jgi:restriction endonuclease Mrr
MALLFETAPLDHPIASDHLSSTDWFGFERAISLLLERHFGFKIEHRATRGKTDYGIDILATKSVGTQIEAWLVQCKCYKLSNLITPSHIRELVGAIADMRTDEKAVVRGMMVTTSRFSGEALKLALKHGIQCIGGDDLTLILNAINVAMTN